MSLDGLETRLVSDEAKSVADFCMTGLRNEITRKIGHYAAREDVCIRATVNSITVGGLIAVRLFDWLVVKTLFVDPAFRKKGIGGLLMKQCEDRARTEGLAGIQLDTHDFLHHGFYTRLGFDELASLSGCPKNHRKIFMAKTF